MGNQYAVVEMKDVLASTSASDPLGERLEQYVLRRFDGDDFSPLDRPGFLETLVEMAPTDRSIVLVSEYAVHVRDMLGSMKWLLGPHTVYRRDSNRAIERWVYLGTPIRGTQTPKTNGVAVRTVERIDASEDSARYANIFVVTPLRKGARHDLSGPMADRLGKNFNHRRTLPNNNGSSRLS